MLIWEWKATPKNRVQPHFCIREQLTIAHQQNGSILLFEYRASIPLALQTAEVVLAHEGHQGLDKTKQLLRDKVWFPGTLLNFYSHKPSGTTSNDRNTTNTMVQDICWFLWSISNKRVRTSSWVTTISDTHLVRYKDLPQQSLWYWTKCSLYLEYRKN